MSDLRIENKDGVLVVDSRLVASRLDVQHKSLLETVRKYQTKIEETFGIITFETAISEESQRGKPAVFCWLTEDQATFVMTLSRNTDEVIDAKLSLVKAFSEAKQALTTFSGNQIHPEIRETLAVLQAQMGILTERTQRLDEVESKLTLVKEASQRHRGCGNVIQSEVDNEGVEDNLFTAKEYLILKKVSLDHFRTLSKRAANFTRVGKGKEPTAKRSGHLLFEETYLREALKSILELD